jgi:multidrug resistance efflux pump
MPEQITNNEEANIKLLSSEVREIISQKPGWLVSNGNILFLAILVALITTTFFIEYPDVVNSKAKFTTINSPKELIAKQSGKLVKLIATEGKLVAKDEIIGFLESNAVHADVLNLYNKIAAFENGIEAASFQNFNITDKNLGELQQPYQTFILAYNNYKQYMASGFFVRKKQMLKEDFLYLQKLHQNLEQQKAMQQEDLSLASKNFNANKSLNEDKVIADLELRNERSRYISKAMSIPQINASIIGNENSRHEKEKEIAQLENEIAQQKVIFTQALYTLKAQIEDWKNRFVLQAPAAGKLSFIGFLQENNQVKAGDNICFITPENMECYAKINIPQQNFGKVKIGEKVLLKLHAYPHREFGIVQAKLDFISAIPTDSGFAAKVVLPNGLVTNYKKQLSFVEGLSADAEIITDNLKLSDRIFNEAKSIFKNQ